MNGKSALGAVSEYMNKEDSKALNEGSEAIKNDQNVIINAVIKDTDTAIMKDIEKSNIRKMMFDKMMDEYKSELNSSPERLEDIKFMINKMLDIYLSDLASVKDFCNGKTDDKRAPNNSMIPTDGITINDIPDVITQLDDPLPYKFASLCFKTSDTKFYYHRLDSWDVQLIDTFKDEKFYVISNAKQAEAMNDYFGMISDIKPDGGYSSDLSHYRENITRPLYMYQKINDDSITSYPPEIQSILRRYTNIEGWVEFIPVMYLYTTRMYANELDDGRLYQLKNGTAEYGNESITHMLTDMTRCTYIGFQTWLSNLTNDIQMLINVKRHMGFFEKIAYRETIRMMDTIINAYKVAFT